MIETTDVAAALNRIESEIQVAVRALPDVDDADLNALLDRLGRLDTAYGFLLDRVPTGRGI